MLQSLFFLTTAPDVSGIITTHLQDHKTPPATHSNQIQLFHDSSRQQYGVTVTRCCGYSCFVLLKMGDDDTRNMYTPPTTHSNQFQLFHDSSRQQYSVTVTRCCSYSCFMLLKMGDDDARNM